MRNRHSVSEIDTIHSRRKLAARNHPYFTLLPGLRNAHLGYRKCRSGAKPSAGGTWLLRYREGSRYRSVAFAQADDRRLPANGSTILTFKQAIDGAARLYSERTAQSRSLPEHQCSEDTYTVGNCVSDYLNWLEYDGKSIDDPLWRIQTHVEPVLKNRVCAQLTADELRAWRDELASLPPRLRTSAIGKRREFRDVDMSDSEVRRKRRASVNRTLCVLRCALNYAFESGILSSDAAWRNLRGFKGVESTEVRFLAERELKPLLLACEDSFRDVVQAALLTGCYYGELQRLRVKDLDRKRKSLHIAAPGHARERFVTLTAQGVDFFERCCADRKADETLFLRPDGQPWAAGHQTRRLRQACADAGIEPAINFTGLRHTYAANLLLKGVPITAVAENLGHRDVRMCERHFGHLLRGETTRIIRNQTHSWLSFDTDIANTNMNNS